MVVPFNSHCKAWEKENWNVVTLHKLIGIGIDERHHCAALNVQTIKVIIFDEIYMLSRTHLRHVYRFMEKHPHIRFVATGDPCQNPKIEIIENFNKASWTTERIIDFLFPSQLNLTIIKRVENESDREVYPLLKHDIFETTTIIKR